MQLVQSEGTQIYFLCMQLDKPAKKKKNVTKKDNSDWPAINIDLR